MKLKTRFLLPVIAASLSFGQAWAEQGTTAGDIDETRSILGKWVATQELIFKEKKEWQQEREILLSRIALVEKEIGALQGKIDETDKARAEADRKRWEVVSEKDGLAGTAEILGETVGEFEKKVRVLYKVLPESLCEKVDPLFRRIPEDPHNTRVSLAERYQNVLGILNEINRINGEITLASEIRPLSDGTPSEVKTVYVGLGTAYFISARGEAGIGKPSPNGWTWEPANALATDIRAVIEILQSRSKPHFVNLPVTIQ